MVQLKDMWRRLGSKGLVGLLILSMAIATSGCAENIPGDGMGDSFLSGTLTDLIQPDVNREKRLVTDPNLVVSDFSDTTQYPFTSSSGSVEGSFEIGSGGSGSGSGDATGEGSTPKPSTGNTTQKAETWKRPVDPSQFEPTKVAVVNASIYGKYLESEVYSPVMELIKDCPDVYFKVFHMGYDYYQREVTVTNPSTSYTETLFIPASPTILAGNNNGRIHHVSGDVIANYLVEWLGGLEVNQVQHNTENSRNNFAARLSNLVSAGVLKDSDTFESVKDSDKVDTIGKDIMSVWEKSSKICATFGLFRASVQDNNWGAIPDLMIQYYKKATALGTVTLNPVKVNRGHTQAGGTSTSIVDVAFTSYNQFHTRDFGVISRWGSGAYNDSGSFLATYTDGYNRTVLYISAVEGKTLLEALGPAYPNVVSLLVSAKQPTDISHFAAESGSENTYAPVNCKGDY